MYELRIHTVPPLVFAGATLAQVGQEHSAINGEVPGITLSVDNAHGQNTLLVATADALRAQAELLRDGDVLYAGAVQSVVLGASIEFGLEA